MDAVHVQSQGLPEQTSFSEAAPCPACGSFGLIAWLRAGRFGRTSSATDLASAVKTLFPSQPVSPGELSPGSDGLRSRRSWHSACTAGRLEPGRAHRQRILARQLWVAHAGGVLGAGGGEHWPRRPAFGLASDRPGGAASGCFILAGMAIGLFLDAGFDTDHLRVPETFDGTIHGVGTWMQALALPVAAFVFGLDFVRHSISTLKARSLLILGAAQLGSIVLFELSPTTTRGWAERLVTVFAVATLGLLQVLSRADAPAIRPTMALTNLEVAQSSVFRPSRQVTEPHPVA